MRGKKRITQLTASILAFIMVCSSANAEETPATTAPTPESTTATETVSPDPTVTPEETASPEPNVSPTAELTVAPSKEAATGTDSLDWTNVVNAIDSGLLYQTETLTIGTIDQLANILSGSSGATSSRVRRAAPRRASGSLVGGDVNEVYATYTVGGKERWSSPMSINGRPAYCLEPGVNTGINYDSELALTSYDKDTAHKMARIAWYGFGNPLTGTDPLDYEATQLLIWKIAVPEKYAEIMQTYTVCPTLPSNINACTLTTGIGPGDIQDEWIRS